MPTACFRIVRATAKPRSGRLEAKALSSTHRTKVYADGTVRKTSA